MVWSKTTVWFTWAPCRNKLHQYSTWWHLPCSVSYRFWTCFFLCHAAIWVHHPLLVCTSFITYILWNSFKLTKLHHIFSLCFSIKLYRQKYGSKKKPRYKRRARQKVLRMTYGTERQKQTTVWWISRAWQKFRHRLTNAPFPFIH